ncbi:MAG: cohesin domain-containing protein [Candidatus Bathyarchaeia archaeon]
MKIKQYKVTLSILMILVSTLMTIHSALSSPTSEVYVDPPDYIYDASTTPIGTLFNVTVKVKYVTDMKTWQVKMWFNDSFINVTRWYEPKWDSNYVFYGKTTLPVPAPPQVAYGPGGWCGVGASLFPAPSPGEGFTGSGVLCIITFNITALPPPNKTYACLLNITNYPDTFWIRAGETAKLRYDIYRNGYYEISPPLIPYDVTINAYCNTEAQQINAAITKDGIPTGYNTPHTFTGLTGTHTFTVPEKDSKGHPFKQWSTGETSRTITVDSGGTFTAYYEAIVIEGTRIYVDPPEIIDPTMLPCSTFDINITIDDVSNMISCEFNLTYDPNVLQWIGIKTFRISGQTPTTQVIIDDEAGFIWVKLRYGSSILTTSPIALVAISFHVEGLGSTVLDLHDTELLDTEGAPIEHQAIDGFFMSLIRDVAVIDAVPSSNWAYPGWPVTIKVTVKNLGNISETFSVRAFSNDTLIGTAPVVDLAPNTQTDVYIPWDTSGLGGIFIIRAEAIAVPYEYDLTNNVLTDGTVEIVTVMHDIAVIDVTPEQLWAYQGWTLKINVTVKNLGETSEVFNLTAYYNDNIIDIITELNIDPGEELTIEYEWNTSLVTPCNNYTIKAEASIVLYEYNVTNNLYVDGAVKVRMPGDANGDGTVDMADISILIEAFMTYPSHPNWKPEADLDRSGYVDMVDISIAIENFNESCLR